MFKNFTFKVAQGLSCLAFLITISGIHTTCHGPAYQPKMPKGLEKYKKEC